MGRDDTVRPSPIRGGTWWGGTLCHTTALHRIGWDGMALEGWEGVRWQ